jgi:hypothetical protein
MSHLKDTIKKLSENTGFYKSDSGDSVTKNPGFLLGTGIRPEFRWNFEPSADGTDLGLGCHRCNCVRIRISSTCSNGRYVVNISTYQSALCPSRWRSSCRLRHCQRLPRETVVEVRDWSKG